MLSLLGRAIGQRVAMLSGRLAATDSSAFQFVLYLIVGGVCFWIDVGGFLIILWLFRPVILLASASSFVIATAANYALCCAFVFRRGRFSRLEEIGRLFLVAVTGLGLNSAVVWILAERMGLDPAIAKVSAVLPVLFWNFLARRVIVFDAALSAGVVKFAGRIGGRAAR